MACKYCKSINKNPGYFVECFEHSYLDKHIWLSDYELIKEVLTRAKYFGETFHYSHNANALCKAAFQELNMVNFSISYIPSVFEHQRNRGYDHAKILAVQVANALGKKVENLLIPIHSQSQVQLDKNERFKNPKYAYISRKTLENILIIDDTATTRSSLNHAALALKNAGAKLVIALTLGYKN